VRFLPTYYFFRFPLLRYGHCPVPGLHRTVPVDPPFNGVSLVVFLFVLGGERPACTESTYLLFLLGWIGGVSSPAAPRATAFSFAPLFFCSLSLCPIFFGSSVVLSAPRSCLVFEKPLSFTTSEFPVSCAFEPTRPGPVAAAYLLLVVVCRLPCSCFKGWWLPMLTTRVFVG